MKYLSPYLNIAVISDRNSSALPQALSEFGIPHFAYRDRTILFLPQLIWYILVHKIDLVYGNSLSGRTRVAFWAARFTKRPYIWHVHESVQENDSRVKEIHFADAVIANSENTAERLRKYARVEAPIVIPNGVEVEKFKLDRNISRQNLIRLLGCGPDDNIVINMGRVCEQKNQLAAVQVGIELLKTYPKTHFLFLGEFQDADYYNKIQSLLQKTKYLDHFHFFGQNNDFIPYLVGSDILIHTSQVESQGLVILEAMASRLPVVAYNVGGVGESIVQSETGFLRPFGDIQGLALDVIKLLSDESLRESMGAAGFERVKRLYTAESSAMKVKKVIDNIHKTKSGS